MNILYCITLTLSAAALLPLATPALAQAAAPAPATTTVTIPIATAGHYDVRETNLGTLLDDAAAKAVIDRNLPTLSSNPQIDMGRNLTLAAIKDYAPDQVSDAALAAIQTDLNALPANK